MITSFLRPMNTTVPSGPRRARSPVRSQPSTVTAFAVASGEPIVVLAGSHVGCYKLFGHESIRNISDLKGKKVGVPGLGSSHHMFVSIMAAHIGLDPVNDIRWVTSASPPPIEVFARERSTRSSAFRRSRKISLLAASVTWSLTPPWTLLGRNISAV